MKAKTGLTRLVNNLVFRFGVISILAGVTFGANIAPAFACAYQPAPSSYPKYTLKERVGLVPYVFSGTITDIKYGEKAIATVKVQLYFKGNGPSTVKISGFSSGADCQETVEINQQAVFFTFGDATTVLTVTSRLNVSQYVKPTEPISGQFLADITQVTGREPLKPPVETATPTANPTVANSPAPITGDVVVGPTAPGKIDVISVLAAGITVVFLSWLLFSGVLFR